MELTELFTGRTIATVLAIVGGVYGIYGWIKSGKP